MSIGGVTGLPFQNNYLNAQKIASGQQGQTGVFSSKQVEGKVLAQKLQDIGQEYQQKGSIFQTENNKTTVVEDGYMGKLADQKWAEVNFAYEQTNAKRANLSKQSLENAVIKTGINLKNYESKIKTTNNEVSDLDNKISANTKELETISQIFATEQQSKDAEAYAKGNYEYSANKDNVLSHDLDSLESEKNKSTATVETTKQKKADAGNTISSLTSNKSNISNKITLNTSKKTSISFDISSIKGQISKLMAQKGSSSAKTTVVTGNNVVATSSNATVAIDTTNNNAATTTLAEAQNSNTVEKANANQTSSETVQDEQNQEMIDAQIDAQILVLENSLNAKIAEQDLLDQENASLEEQAAKLDKDIAAKQKESKSLDSQIENQEGSVSEIDNKITSKKNEIEANQKVTKEREDIYKKASEVHSADLEKRQAVEEKYSKLTAETEAMKEKRTSSDAGLKKLNGLKEYFSILLDGQGSAKAGAEAEVDIAEEKADKQYETLQVKNKVVVNSKVSLFSQKDTEFKAKNDLTSVKTEMESYSNIFSTVKKAS